MIKLCDLLKGRFKIKKLFLLVVCFSLFFSVFFMVEHTGFASQATESSVTISWGGPVVPPVIPPTGGGGGTTTPPVVENQSYDFILDKDFLAIELNKGDYYQTQVTANNTGSQDLLINVSVFNLEQFIFSEQDNFTLEVQGTETTKFDVYALKDVAADVYLGKLNFVSEHVEKYVNVVLDIKDEFSLFDIKTSVLKKYIIPGNSVTAEVMVVNLVELGKIDVEMEYGLRGFDNNTYTSKKEIVVMDGYINKTLSLDTLEEMGIGQYVFYSKVTYKNMSASSYDTFILEKVSVFTWVIILLIIFVTMILVFVLIKRRKDKLKK